MIKKQQTIIYGDHRQSRVVKEKLQMIRGKFQAVSDKNGWFDCNNICFCYSY